MEKREDRFELTPEGLDLESIGDILRKNRRLELSGELWYRIEKANRYVFDLISREETVYGINTGFGRLSQVRIPGNQLIDLQYNLLKSHAAGVGEALPEELCRIILLLKIICLSRGNSGCSPVIVKGLLQMYNQDIIPVIPSQGSVGASGDLAPLAHLALPLIGRGEVYYQGRRFTLAELQGKVSLPEVKLGPKDGLSLINGTQAITGILVQVLLRLERLLKLVDLTAAMTTDASKSSLKPFYEQICTVRKHPGMFTTAANIRMLLNNSEINASHRHCPKIQDPYCIRCVPQVHGSVKDAYLYVKGVVEREINAVTDNPLVFPDERLVLSGGNFHGEPLAHAADFLAIVLTSLSNITERRIALLMDSNFSGLPPFLVKEGGINSGLMIAQVVAASLVNENKVYSAPSSVDSIPTSANQEDYVSMGFWGARKLLKITDNLETVILIELLSAFQGLYLNLPLKSSPLIQKVYDLIIRRIEPWESDRELWIEIEKLRNLVIQEGVLDSILRELKLK